jgi:uncharacterized membrane protein
MQLTMNILVRMQKKLMVIAIVYVIAVIAAHTNAVWIFRKT